VPQISTKPDAVLIVDAPEAAHASRVERARRRIGEHYYDRPEVRRTLASLILRRVRRAGAK
jgi:hypothetical protein